jgi:putative ABC transport system permease protein
MKLSTLSRKAWGDLTRHPGRTLLAAFTLCIAVATLGFIAVPGLLGSAMNRQVAASHLNDVGISMKILDLTPGQLSSLGRLPGVAAVSPVLGYTTTATSAAGRENASIVGGDLSSAPVNTVPVLSGNLPGAGEVLADAGNARAADYATPAGSTISMRNSRGTMVTLRVTGTGLNLAATPGANGSTTPVFYATLATVESLRGVHGYNYLGFRLTRDTTAGQNQVIAEARAYLTRIAGTDPITSLPAVRDAGTYPGKAAFSKTATFLYIITVLAFISALFLISSTMNTLIAEQAGEIAILKTLGARRRQIAGITVRTAVMLGAIGAIPGTILGVLFADLLARNFAVRFIDVAFGFAVSVPVIVVSLLIGPVLAVAASLPGLRRALRRPVAQTLAGDAAASYGSGWLDRAVARSGLLSSGRLSTGLRMGLRNALRSKRRSAATIAQVAVAAGLAISLLALGQSIDALIGQAIGKLHFSVGVGEAATSRSQPFTSRAVAIAAGTPGVTAAQPTETSTAEYDGQPYAAWGLGARPLYSYDLSSGHWFTAAQAAASAADTAVPPVVIGPVVATATGAKVGQTLMLTMAQGPARVRVIGIDIGGNDSGAIVYFPRPVLERLDGNPGAADSIWVSTASSSHAAIDRAETAVSRRLGDAGFPASTQAIYVIQQQTTAAENSFLAIVEILGVLIVAIMLMGLASSLSMGVMERTREIGILRCVGARARNIRRVFTTEAVTLAIVGWVIGIGVGWLIFEGLIVLIRHDDSLSLPQTFTPGILLITLVGVVVLTLLVIRGPLHRASRIRPGAALRYQ